ncbi:MAG: YolD-like family protein [Butyrivibrio sp.]|uniref:YolD-like family protein n=1 Tax=Butyrivibrio sp. TaxID=28121 RepID=UPI001B1F7A80|nr:YolD-like family protein [Butyrivibrio sp.]MBO6241089.1 YolD-like family protein [Butyrivibrio sp.]
MARQKMSIDKRAAQFLPFKAVSGLDEALLAKEKIIVPKIELSEEMYEELDKKMHELSKGCIASCVYFSKGEYLRATGMVARIDETSRILQIVNTRICFEDILDVEKR